MPFSTVCVSTVGSRPRTWSSYSNLRAKDEQDPPNMNALDEITVYKDPNDRFRSPTLTRRTLGYSYDLPEKTPKKEKKWSISSIFRRKKKAEESDSSSEEDSQKRGFLNRRRKKPEGKRKPRNKTVGTFDHVVMPPTSRLTHNGYNQEENGILSDPTGGFSNYIGRPLPQTPSETMQKYSKESLNDVSNSGVSLGSGSIDSVGRKSRRGLFKARAEARRTSSRNSSSEEESQRSNSSLQMRSEDNLTPPKDGSSNKKTRTARTERYLKRHSRDGENPHNYLRLSKSDVENSAKNWKLSDDSNRSPSRSPLLPVVANAKNVLPYTNLNSQSQLSGLSTIPPSHGNYSRFRVSNSTSNPSYKPPQSMNEYHSSTKKLDVGSFPDQRSISCDANIHKAPSSEFTENVLHVQFPVTRPNKGYRNLSLIDPSHLARVRQPPPPPPPRDPTRMIGVNYYDGGRPNTYYYDGSNQPTSKSFNSSNPIQQSKRFNSFNLNPNFRSTSEDHLPRDTLDIQLATRPSSTTPESNLRQKYLSRRNEVKANPEDFRYLTDKNPRSRKPICIKQGAKNVDSNISKEECTGSQKALHFWKQIDRQNASLEKPTVRKPRANSPQIFTSHTRVQTKVFLPSVLQTDIKSSSPTMKDNRSPSPFKPITSTLQEVSPDKQDLKDINLNAVDKHDIKRKSSNLEEALDELEAIYNSLRLGDEDLLERAEQREKDAQAKQYSQTHIDNYPNYSARGALSDSSFSYEPFDTVDSPRRKRMLRKHRTVDIKQDDMAFRKMNRERSHTVTDPQAVISKVSFLEASPVHGKHFNYEVHDINEPDITQDDVVFRNIKHANSALKVVEPQPPFGIPLGPITPAANSDYLHAKPENVIYRPTFKHKKIPDVVKDDLAFRNLRKDDNKGPALPPLAAEDFKNNNSDSLSYLKKKRAQRSLSANIGSLIHADVIERARNRHIQNNNDVENEFKTLTDIADAMEIARRVLKEKENKISATQKACMSDTDIQPVTNSFDLREGRLSFLSGMKSPLEDAAGRGKPSSPRLGLSVLNKPPRGSTPERVRRSPKESTPIPISPLEDKKSVPSESTSSSLDDLLNALAEEAKETTERINNELKLLTDENEKRSSLKRDERNREDKLELCEKLLECVVDSTNLMSSSKDTAEEVEQIDENPVISESANVVVDRTKEVKKDEKEESDHDYENLHSDKELNIDEVDITTALEGVREPEKCKSPFEEHKAELIASFQDLKEKMKDIELPMKRDNPEHGSSKVDSIYDNLQGNCDVRADKETFENEGVTGETACGDVFDVAALPNQECAFTINANPLDSVQAYTSNCDIVLKQPLNFILHEDSESSSGFHSNCSCGDSSHYPRSDTVFDEFGSNNNLDSLESLKSPKLVLATAHKVSSRNNDTRDNGRYAFPKSPRLVLAVSRDNKNSARRDVASPSTSRSDRQEIPKPSSPWHRDPATVAFACSHGLACAHQLASIDLFAILGIIFAVVSFIAALFL